jgi:hypothetical protein
VTVLQRECRFRYQEKQIRRRQRVAETRRRWQIQFYRTNGKRDHRWQGTFWSQDVADEAKEKEVFCIGSADILALVQDKWRLRANSSDQVLHDDEKEHDTREHIRDLTDQVALTAATSQVEQTKALLDPVFRNVERSFDKVQRLQRGHDSRVLASRQERNTPNAASDMAAVQADHTTELHRKQAHDPLLYQMDRQQRKRQLLLAGRVPWPLLDQLEAERRSLAHEKAMFKLWGKTCPK